MPEKGREKEVEEEHTIKLSQDQILTYLKDGILVVPNILTPSQLQSAKLGFENTLKYHNVDPNDLKETGANLRLLSSTNGSGGVLDIFYPNWKMINIVTNKCLFDVTCQLWEASLCHNGETEDKMTEDKKIIEPKEGEEGERQEEDCYYKWHPYGSFDCRRGYACIDRIGYRLPTILAEEIGNEHYLSQLHKNNKYEKQSQSNNHTYHNTNTTNTTTMSKKQRKKLKANSIQRSLTPHLDCCPTTYNSTTDEQNQPKKKWRPIQCFIALTTNDTPNTGGFEACPTFHRNFHEWALARPKTTTGGNNDGIPAPCIGEYTHIRPKEDNEIYKRMKHISVPEGGAVFWDNRIPHANSYVHEGDDPRMVVYASFLPDVECNRLYAMKQLEDWRGWKRPRDFWIEVDEKEEDGSNANKAKNIEDDEERDFWKDETDEFEQKKKREEYFTVLGRKLMGIDQW